MMPDVQCENCNAHFLNSMGDVTLGACPKCGHRPERDQSSGSKGDDGLRNVPNSAVEDDTGGNPLGEGVITGKDGYRRVDKRDESYASVKHAGTPLHNPWGYSTFWQNEAENVHRMDPLPPGEHIYHQAPTSARESILKNGLRPGSYASCAPECSAGGYPGPEYDIWKMNKPDDAQIDVQGSTHMSYPSWYLPSGAKAEIHQQDAHKNQEGTWAKVAAQVVTPGPAGIHGGPLNLLRKLSTITIDGVPVNFDTFNKLYSEYGMHGGPKFGKPVVVDSHDPAFTALAAKIIQDGHGLQSAYQEDLVGLHQGIENGTVAAPKTSKTADAVDPEPTHPVTAVLAPCGLHGGTHVGFSMLDATVNGERTRDQDIQFHPELGGEPITVHVHDPSHADAARSIIEKGTYRTPEMKALIGNIKNDTVPAPPYILRQRKEKALEQSYEHGHQASRFSFDIEDFNMDAEPTHKFIIDRNNVYSAEEPTTHEEIAAQNGLLEAGFPNGFTLGTLLDDGDTEILQHQTQHGPEQLADALEQHFGHPVTIDPTLKPRSNEERWGLEPLGVSPQERNSPRAQDKIKEEEELVKQRGRPYPYYDNPIWNRGGNVIAARDQSIYIPWQYQSTQHRAFWQALLAPVAGLLGRGGAKALAGPLMRGALSGPGSNAIQGAGQGAPQAQPPAQAPDINSLSHTADVETPGSVKEIGAHDKPEDIDQKEFNVGDLDNNPRNPQLDAASQGAGVGENTDIWDTETPGLQRLDLLGSLLMQYYHSDDSGANDAQIRELHHLLESENPGYLDNVSDEDEELFRQALKAVKQQPGVTAGAYDVPGLPVQPSTGPLPQQAVLPPPGNNPATEKTRYCPSCKATIPEGIAACPNCSGSIVNAPQNTALNAPQPGISQPFAKVIEAQSNSCQHCGSPLTGPGPCPKCGSPDPRAEGVDLNKIGPSRTEFPWDKKSASECTCSIDGNGSTSTRVCPVHGDEALQKNPKYAGEPNHQGPITDEQKAAVAELLIENGRQNEIPDMLKEPWNYADELAQVAGRQTIPPNVDQPTQPPPTQEEADPNQTMPMPPMSAPPLGQPNSKVAGDNIAKQCPRCDSHTTSLLSDTGESRCATCGNIYKTDVLLDDVGKESKTAEEHQHYEPAENVDARPAAEQHHREEIPDEQDSSLTWQDNNGEPLEAGQKYEMHSPNYTIPDIVSVDNVKPNAVTVTTVGEYSNEQPEPDLSYSYELTKEEADIEGITFVNSDAANDQEVSQDIPLDDQQSTEPQPSPTVDQQIRSNFQKGSPDSGDDQYFGGKPGSSHKAFKAMIEQYGKEKGEEVYYATRNKHKTKKSSKEISREESDALLEKLNYDFDPDEFHTGCNVELEHSNVTGGDPETTAQIAAAHLQEKPNYYTLLKKVEGSAKGLDWLNDGTWTPGDMEKTAGASFSLQEQREFIEEDGIARNSDLLNLEGTHYEARHRDIARANPNNVPDEQLLFY